MTLLQVHGSCVALNGKGVLIRGISGSGKSDLVLRLIDAAGFGVGETLWRGQLVADDQVVLTREGNDLIANPPESLAGKLEIRGQGIVTLPWVANIRLTLVVDLAVHSDIPRMPEAAELTTELCGLLFPRLYLHGSQTSAPARIRSFLC